MAAGYQIQRSSSRFAPPTGASASLVTAFAAQDPSPPVSALDVPEEIDVTTTGYDTKTTRMRWTRTDLDSVVAVPGGHLALGRAPQLTLVGFDPAAIPDPDTFVDCLRS